MNISTRFNLGAIFFILGILILAICAFIFIPNIYALIICLLSLFTGVVLFFKMNSKEAEELRELNRLIKSPIDGVRSDNKEISKLMGRLIIMKKDGTISNAPTPPVYIPENKSEEELKALKLELESLRFEIKEEFAKLRKDVVLVKMDDKKKK